MRIGSIALVLWAVSLLAGCGAIGKATSSEASLLDKAEMATGVSADTLKVVPNSVKAKIDSVHYKVETSKGQLYRCYYTTLVGAMDSDAVCTKIGKGEPVKAGHSTSETGNCNALLRAAGRC